MKITSIFGRGQAAASQTIAAATGRTALNAAAKKLRLAKRELKLLGKGTA